MLLSKLNLLFSI